MPARRSIVAVSACARFIGLSLLYGAMYVLMTLEDFAFFAGSVVAFAVIAAAMIATRRIDWYRRTRRRLTLRMRPCPPETARRGANGRAALDERRPPRHVPRQIEGSMVELTLPQNSKVKPGKRYKAPKGAKRVRQFKVYRYDPETGENPRWDIYELDLDSCGPMVLDALIAIKNDMDSTLTFRRSCREGVCGSCAMNISRPQHAGLHQGHGRNAGGRDHHRAAAAPAGAEGPGAGSHQLHRAIRRDPALPANRQPPSPDAEWRQSPEERAKLDGLYECILCACCSTACPSYWWNADRFMGPAALLQAYRWISDSRDENTRRAARCARRSRSSSIAATPS